MSKGRSLTLSPFARKEIPLGKEYPKIQKGICAAGLSGLALLFLLWMGNGNAGTWQEFLSSLLCLVLFAALCLRFVPQWFSLWFGPETKPAARLPAEWAESSTPLKASDRPQLRFRSGMAEPSIRDTRPLQKNA